MTKKTPMEEGYVQVADRLEAFTKEHPNGRIATRLVHMTFDPSVVSKYWLSGDQKDFQGAGVVAVFAEVWKTRSEDPLVPPDGTGLSGMPIPGPTNYTRNSEIENAETSAVGRALAMIGYLAKTADGKPRISSSDEIAAKSGDDQAAPDSADKASTAQKNKMFAQAKEAGINTGNDEGKAMLSAIVLSVTGKHSSKQLTSPDMDKVYGALNELKKVREATGGGEVE